MENYNVEDEISLKELIEILLGGWKTIVAFVVVGGLLAGVYSFVIAKPVYETEVDLFMNIPEAVATEVGTYQYPSSNEKDYFDLFTNEKIVNQTIKEYELESDYNGFAKRLNVSQDKDLSVIQVTYRGGNPEEIAKILDGHISNFRSYMQYSFKTDAIEKFLIQDKVTLTLKEKNMESVKAKLLEAEAQLKEQSPFITLQKALTSNPEVAAQYARERGISVSELSNHMLVEEIVNPLYTQAEKLVSDYKHNVSSLEIEMKQIQERVELLEDAKGKFSEETMFEESSDDFLSVLELPIKQLASANVPLSRVSPRRTLNVAIGIVLSGMIAVFVVFFKAYWKNN